MRSTFIALITATFLSASIVAAPAGYGILSGPLEDNTATTVERRNAVVGKANLEAVRRDPGYGIISETLEGAGEEGANVKRDPGYGIISAVLEGEDGGEAVAVKRDPGYGIISGALEGEGDDSSTVKRDPGYGIISAVIDGEEAEGAGVVA